MSTGQFLHLPCMTTFGAPNTPSIVLGGYDGDNYSSAKSMMITFAVKNSVNEADNKMAEAWEKAFINYLHNWHNGTENNITIAYSSERSIQDEINESSISNVVTILLSYLLMFLYIAVGLGQFKSMSRILVRCFCVYSNFNVLPVVLLKFNEVSSPPLHGFPLAYSMCSKWDEIATISTSLDSGLTVHGQQL